MGQNSAIMPYLLYGNPVEVEKHKNDFSFNVDNDDAMC